MFLLSVEHRPLEGVYDLTIASAGYDRDNGHFECRLVEGGTGRDLHSHEVDLTVLLRPSAPAVRSSVAGGTAVLTEKNPVVLTEGRTANLTCASVGGSPPPDINWYTTAQEPLIKRKFSLHCSLQLTLCCCCCCQCCCCCYCRCFVLCLLLLYTKCCNW